MIYQAKITKLDDDIEEEVTLLVNGVELTCFASVCPYRIEAGNSYCVQLELVVLDDYLVEGSVDGNDPAFTRAGSGYTYFVRGKMNGMHLEAGGLVFKDEVLLGRFGHLDGKMIKMRADRIDVEFLPQGLC